MTTLADLLQSTLGAQPVVTINKPVVNPVKQVDLVTPLLPWQKKAVNTILRGEVPHALFADPGLGKSAMATAVIASVLAADADSKALVVVPPSLLGNWGREITKFAPHLTVATLRKKAADYIPNANVVLVGNAIMPALVDLLSAQQFDTLVVDESHEYKDWSSKRSKALVAIAETIKGIRLIMTGTPIPNGRHAEFIPQFDILGEDAWRALGGRGRFFTRYAPKIDSWGGRGSANGAELRDALYDSFAQRIKRDDVIKLAGKSRNPVVLDCGGPESKAYVRLVNDFIAWLRDEGYDTRGAMRAEAIVKLNHMRRQIGIAKVDGTSRHVESILHNNAGGVLIFAEHVDVMDLLTMRLAKWNPVSVRGETSAIGKERAVEAFSAGDSRVMIGQIKSAGVGLTLHGDGRNTHVVMAQVPWTPAALQQAEDRIYRIGQPNKVHSDVIVGRIDGQWSIDERLWGIIESKHFAIGEIMDDDDELLTGIQGGLIDSFR